MDTETAVRAFVAEQAPDGRYPADWNRRLAGAGYVVPHWPRPWGLDATPTEQLAIDEVLRELRSPRPMNPIGIGWAGPTLLVAGTDVQQQRWLPGILDGSDLWCQLFSEPGAGSDLASLQTRAVRDGDEYVVNGQKVWTTLAHVARYGILLARTNPDAEDHHGITYFVVDMRSPGVEVRPLVQMTGTHEFNEVFFTDVRVPVANVVGAVDDGWRLAKVTLGNERVSLSGEGALWGRGPTAQDVIALVRAHGGTRDPVLRQRLAALYCEAEVLRLIRLRTVSARVRGLEPGPEASVRKALSDEHGQHVMEAAKELAGTYGLLSDIGPYGEPDTHGWHYGYLYARALTIGGGTSEVQRNILGEKVLGLPHDPRVKVPPDVRDWLTAVHEALPDRDISAREHDQIAERLATLTRALRPRRTAVDGAIVMHHPSGRAFAAASGDRFLVRTSSARATLAAEPIEELPGWVAIDPFPADVAFERGTNVLRDLLARAYADAAS